MKHFPILLAIVLTGFTQAKPPNIVIILSDDQSWTDYGFMGHPEIKTPHLDRLAEESATFTRGYVPTALCRPALMSIATELYAHQTCITGNDPAPTPANKAHEMAEGKTAKEILISNIDRHGALPKWLSQEGYFSFQSTPFSPPSGPAQRLFQGPASEANS
ncbi:sulfatase-like hydrolase/transferase [Haloferula sp. A504]|uniref:sulfatase-like hydrolase/transferase n=1 Tax=Haloferula sp. A504 TaxID=3373601 RepID=UPI0031BBD235|nr:sulfatase-like hydrolase/transferase [Verrucomicrobiaceae bacterium E54]